MSGVWCCVVEEVIVRAVFVLYVCERQVGANVVRDNLASLWKELVNVLSIVQGGVSVSGI